MTQFSPARPSLSSIDRRAFLASTAAAAAGVLVVEPGLAANTASNSKLTLGLIGCGGRGKWIAKLFQQHGGYRFVATADYFPDRAGSGRHVGGGREERLQRAIRLQARFGCEARRDCDY